MDITKNWWNEINPKQDVYLPLDVIKKLFVKKRLTSDAEQAEKIIFNILGKIVEMDFVDFYKLFSKPIFRVALQDMMINIEKLSSESSDLPLILKLGAYRRNLMLSGLDKAQNEYKERGKSILYAMKLFKT